VEEAEPLFIY